MAHVIKDTDRGYAALMKRAFGMKKRSVGVGILDGSGNEDGGMSVLQVAIWAEFGTSTQPERSFIRAWFDENQTKCRAALKAMGQAVLKGKYTPDAALELVAQKFVGEIQARISQGVPPPNAPSTIARKGSDTPLINTGVMRSAVSYKVK